MRAELEAALGAALPARRPVVAFYKDEISRAEEYVPALRRLSRFLTIIYKTTDLDADAPVCAALKGAALIWPQSGYAQNILRFGVDAILAGYCSGTFASSVMLGLKVLPYYTEKIILRRSGERFFYDYRHCLKGQGATAMLNRLLGTLVNINDKARILTLLESEIFWKGYRSLLPPAQKTVFGDYIIENAARKTAMLLLKAFTRGSMGEDVIALRPRAVSPE